MNALKREAAPGSTSDPGAATVTFLKPRTDETERDVSGKTERETTGTSRVPDEVLDHQGKLSLAMKLVVFSARKYVKAEFEGVISRGSEVTRGVMKGILLRLLIITLAIVSIICVLAAVVTLLVELTPLVPASVSLAALAVIIAAVVVLIKRKENSESNPLSSLNHHEVPLEHSREELTLQDGASKVLCAREILTDRGLIFAKELETSLTTNKNVDRLTSAVSGAMIGVRYGWRAMKLLFRAHPITILAVIIGLFALCKALLKIGSYDRNSVNLDGKSSMAQDLRKKETADHMTLQLISLATQMYHLAKARKQPSLDELLTLSTTGLAVVAGFRNGKGP